MWKYIAKRILMLIPVLLGVLIIVFILSEITPGDPARSIAGELATEEEVEAVREKLGLNRPAIVRFGDYLYKLIAKGDLGRSYQTKQQVGKEVMERLPTTLLLACLSTVFMVIVGVPLGILSATKQYSFIDNICSVFGIIGVSMPVFWQGLMMILVFSVYLHWLPPSGFYSPKYWILPSIAAGTVNAAQVMRMTRSSMLDVIHQDYIQAARAKGFSELAIIRKHALKNALIPVLTVVGITFGILLGGAIVTESVFAISGLGSYIIGAINMRDHPQMQGGIIILAFMMSFVTILTDILYAFVDPRVKTMYKNQNAGSMKKHIKIISQKSHKKEEVITDA